MTEVTPQYRKDFNDEEFLKSFNLALQKLERDYTTNTPELNIPVIFILGAPRSGTTLLTQLMAASGCFTYIDNFVARFWMAPVVGMYLEKLLHLRDAFSSTGYTFTSDLGRTEGLLDPHEFSYFWQYWLKPKGDTDLLPPDTINNIDLIGLRREVQAMMSLSIKPIFFKNKLIFVNPWTMNRIFSNSFFVIIRRDILSNAVSILRARRKYYGDERKWFSTKPSRYHELRKLPVEDQILGQISNIYSDIESQCLDLSDKVISLKYEEVCSAPIDAVSQVCTAIGFQIDREALGNKIPARLNISMVDPESVDAQRFLKVMDRNTL